MVHEFFEKPLGKQSVKFNFGILGILYFIILIICLFGSMHHESFIVSYFGFCFSIKFRIYLLDLFIFRCHKNE